ncbi:DUF3108 domain-containing protein [Lichenibacterium dinghuense]|uniref:DUF3108 domain-containing protein n=1 Tax=Lichenibacterium dinghuense TaxID=2895977 RepID=UPI001F44EF6D|nr:DUF3108 domain-containing protein [Lichenibacterium sp. 6Y81]
MKRPLQALAASALLALPAAAAPAPAPVAEPTPIHLKYGVALIGLPIGTATVDGTVGAKDYKLSGTGKLTGIAGVLVDTKGAVTATGNLHDGRVVPSGFAATAGTPHYLLTIRMSEDKNAATQVEINPAYTQTPDRIPITPADKRGIIDPMSSFIMPVPGTGELLGPAACDRTLPLFDGGVRFDINLSFKRVQQVATPAYTGPVAVCGARYRPISGYRPDRPVNKFMIDNKDMEVWLAPVGTTRFVYPHHLAVMSMIGMVTIDATEAAVGAPAKAAAAH